MHASIVTLYHLITEKVACNKTTQLQILLVWNIGQVRFFKEGLHHGCILSGNR